MTTEHWIHAERVIVRRRWRTGRGWDRREDYTDDVETFTGVLYKPREGCRQLLDSDGDVVLTIGPVFCTVLNKDGTNEIVGVLEGLEGSWFVTPASTSVAVVR